MKKENNFRPLNLKDVVLTGGLLGEKNRVVHDIVIPYQWNALNDNIPGAEPSHAIENFRIAAGESKGEFVGMVFQDSDVAKWLEAVAYKLATHMDNDLKKLADGVIATIEKAQEVDGYLNTYFILKEPDKKWTNLAECHELYCAGHMLEAAVAYFDSTSDDKLLNIMIRFIDLIDKKFGPEDGKLKGYPGHQEIELALMRLYKITNDEKHLKLAKFFIDERGKKPYYFEAEWEKRGKTSFWPQFKDGNKGYAQAHIPVREQSVAIGHSVRAVYMYSGMTDVAVQSEDISLAETCRTLWNNTTKKQMYITGGIGSSGFQESFTFDYDLPNDTAYTETCASIGLVFWAHRMLHMDIDGQYADVLERALYNGVLSGMSQDGERFFYVNPLEVMPQACDKRDDKKHVEYTRQKWFGCACCPPNLARLLASIGTYIYSENKRGLYIHLYNDSRTSFQIEGNSIELEQKTNYPWAGKVDVILSMSGNTDFDLSFRIPGWCQKWSVLVNGNALELPVQKGYLIINRIWADGDHVTLNMDMPIERVYSNPELRENSGKTSIQRGPVVFCLEEADNGKNLPSIFLKDNTVFQEEFKKDLLNGVMVLKAEAYQLKNPGCDALLYDTKRPEAKKSEITMIPYFAWDNRDPGEMLVWIREH